MPNPNEYLAKESLLALKQDKLVAGDNITIDPITNRISAQTGAGTVTDVKVDNVSVVNASGIANVDLSGKQNTLTPGTNITIQNNVISATGGTEVEANPADPATDTLTTVDIDGTIYDIAGSGGSSVVPNPQGTPTDTLDSIEIDGDIYEVGSGNTNYTELTQAEYDALTPAEKMNGELYFITDGITNGLQGMTHDILYQASTMEGAAVNAEITYADNHKLSEYDLILIYNTITASTDASRINVSVVYSPNDTDKNELTIYGYDTRYTIVQFEETYFKTLAASGESAQATPHVYTLIGLKGHGEDGLIDDIIYQGTTDVSTFTLTNNIANYDYLYIKGGYSESTISPVITGFFSTQNLINSIGITPTQVFGIANDAYYYYFAVNSNTQFTKNVNNKMFIQEIHGLKFIGGGGSGSGGTEVIPNPQGSPTDQLNKLEINGEIYSIEGNANYNELMNYEYEALTDDEKNNGTIYFTKILSEEPYDGTPTKIGEFYQIDNSKLNPEYNWNNEVKWFFNQYDAYYILNSLGLWNSNFQPPYNHSSNQSDTRNSLIIEGMPVDTCYVITTIAGANLGGKYTYFIPKEIIDNGIGCMTRNGFYSTQDFTFYACSNWGNWNNPADYGTINSFTFDHTQGIHHLSCDQYNTTALTDFTNIPWLTGEYFVSGGQVLQDSLDTYLADRNYSNFPYFYNINYFNYNNIMSLKYAGVIHLNSINYTGSKISANPVGTATSTLHNVKIDGNIYVVPDGTTADDTSYDNTNSGLSATNVQDVIDEISVIDGLTDVNISSPTDGQALIYDATNQKWVNGSSGGGTTVIPNPQGTPTDTLSTIQIGNDIFEIEGSGGSGGGGRSFSMTDLLTSPVTNPSTITLTDDIDNYDALVFELGINAGGADQLGEYTLYTSMLSDVSTSFTYIYLSVSSGYSVFYGVYKSGSNELTVANQGQSGWTEPKTIYRIKGVKFGSSSGESGGYTSTKIWDYVEDNGGVISYGSYTLTLNENINNYDMLAIENVSASSDLSDANWNSSNLWYVDVNMLNNNINANYITYTSWDQRATRFYIKDTTFQATSNNDANTNGTVRVFGIKFGGSGSGTNVEPNPIDEPTDTLSTIRIGDTVYDIAGSGSRGSNYFETTLYENQTSSQQSTLSLSESVFDFDQIVFMINRYSNPEGNCKVAYMFPASELATNTVVNILGWSGSNDWLCPVLTANDTFTVTNVGNASGFYIKKVLGIKTSSSGGSSEATSEIIPITAGDGTTSRTFTFDRIPKKISMQYVAGGWGFYRDIIWGTDRSYYQASQATISDSATYIGVSGIVCDETTKSVTITGLNAIQAANTTDIVGYMFVDYGENSISGGSEDILDMTWTQLISQAGGSWSTATAIPSGTTHVALVVDYDNKAYMPQTFKLSDWDKYASILNHSLVEWGFDWKVGSSYDTIQLEYDSTNKTIKTYAGYNGLTLKTYALS